MASRGLSITATQLERWRSQGYLPRHVRRGLGRGAGSRSEPVAGLHDYVEGLGRRAGQGRSTDEAVLSLFMAGLVWSRRVPRTDGPDELEATHIASVRRALGRWIDSGDRDRDRIARLADDGGHCEAALDEAYAEAERVARRRTSRAKITHDRIGAELSGTASRTREEIRTAEEQAYLSAARLREPLGDRGDGRAFADVWDTGSVPLDAHFFRDSCRTCASRTEHMASSAAGQRDILASTCFCEMNRARAIGGAASMLVAGARAAALADPGDPFARASVRLISNTVFRFLLRDLRKVSPDQPTSIASCTLFFLHDCAWLKSGAAVLTQLAIWKTAAAEGAPGVVEVGRAVDEVLHRPSLLRSAEGIGMLLMLDGTLESAELLRRNSAHCHSSCVDRAHASAARHGSSVGAGEGGRRRVPPDTSRSA